MTCTCSYFQKIQINKNVGGTLFLVSVVLRSLMHSPVRNHGPEAATEEFIPAITHFGYLNGALDYHSRPSPADHAVIDAKQTIQGTEGAQCHYLKTSQFAENSWTASHALDRFAFVEISDHDFSHRLSRISILDVWRIGTFD